MAFEELTLTLAAPNLVDNFSVTSGNTFTLPLDRVLVREQADVARTSDLTIQFDVLFDRVRAVGVFALLAHNLSADAQWRVRAYNDTDLLYDSGTVDAWPVAFESLELEWEDDNYWEGTITDDDRSLFTPLAIEWLGENIPVDKITVDIIDTGNPDSWLQFGRILAAPVFQPEHNATHGIQMDFLDATEIEEAQDGTEYFDDQTPRRTARFILEHLSEEEAFSTLYRLRRRLQTSGEILFAFRLLADSSYMQRTFVGRFSAPSPITHPRFAAHDHAVQIQELI